MINTAGYGEICSVCGKQFYIGDRDNWAYKCRRRNKTNNDTSVKWFCSWHCMREEEKEHERKKELRRKKYAERKSLYKRRVD